MSYECSAQIIEERSQRNQHPEILPRSHTQSDNVLVSVLHLNTRADALIITITLSPCLVLEVVQLRADSVLAEQNPASEPPRQDLGQLVLGVSSSRDTKDVIQLFESALLGLVQEEEDHPESDEVHCCVEAEGALDTEGFELAREGDGDDCCPEVVCCYGPGHADFTMGEWEDFCRVGEGDGSFARRVEGVVDVDEKCDQTEMGTAAWRNPVAHACQQQAPTHIWECEE